MLQSDSEEPRSTAATWLLYMGVNASTGGGGERHYQPTGGGGGGGTGSWYSQSTLMADSDRAVFRGEKKRKASRFATLRKKLLGGRRGGGGKNVDHSRTFRAAAASWTTREIGMLLDEYDAMAVVRELQLLASLARPQASTFRKDLSNLFDAKHCTDVDLVFQGVVFPVHRAILSVRCAFFRDLLARYPDFGAQVPIVPRTPGVSVQLFAALLRYLYCGDFHSVDTTRPENVKVLRRLAAEFGSPNVLEHDMRNLLETGMYSDAVLVFALEPDHRDSCGGSSESPVADYRRSCGELQLRCHKAVLAARSVFFRNLLLRRTRNDEEEGAGRGGGGDRERGTLQSPTHIVLDVGVIPRRYARVLLHAIYLDTVDLSCIVRNSVSMCSLTEVQATVSGGRNHLTIVEEVMEIYQIGRFLDFPILTQGCEDKLVDSLSPDNIVSILNWSCQPHGSHWVHRQALHYLRDEYLTICHTPAFYDLNKWYLIEALRSDFVQVGLHSELTLDACS
jgi:BTB/POZ domain-containing protein 7